MSGKDNLLRRASTAKAKSPQLMRGEVRKCLESLRFDPKPDDLTVGKVKQL